MAQPEPLKARCRADQLVAHSARRLRGAAGQWRPAPHGPADALHRIAIVPGVGRGVGPQQDGSTTKRPAAGRLPRSMTDADGTLGAAPRDEPRRRARESLSDRTPARPTGPGCAARDACRGRAGFPWSLHRPSPFVTPFHPPRQAPPPRVARCRVLGGRTHWRPHRSRTAAARRRRGTRSSTPSR